MSNEAIFTSCLFKVTCLRVYGTSMMASCVGCKDKICSTVYNVYCLQDSAIIMDSRMSEFKGKLTFVRRAVQ